MSKNITVRRVAAKTRRGYYRVLGTLGMGMALSPMAWATTGGDDLPADLDSAPAWFRTKILAGLALCTLLTLGYLAFKGAKVPRRA